MIAIEQARLAMELTVRYPTKLWMLTRRFAHADLICWSRSGVIEIDGPGRFPVTWGGKGKVATVK